MRKTLLAAVALICASTAANSGQHRNTDGSISDDVLINLGNGQYLGPSTGLPVSTSPSGLSETQTLVTLPAGVSTTLVLANASRRSLRWMVTGTNPMTVAPGLVAVIVGAGMNYGNGSGVGQQGGSETFEGTAVPTGAFSAISAAGTVVVIWEGQ